MFPLKVFGIYIYSSSSEPSSCVTVIDILYAGCAILKNESSVSEDNKVLENDIRQAIKIM